MSETTDNNEFFAAYIGECRNGRVKITTDRDCLRSSRKRTAFHKRGENK